MRETGRQTRQVGRTALPTALAATRFPRFVLPLSKALEHPYTVRMIGHAYDRHKT
jgi:hypothetical protein